MRSSFIASVLAGLALPQGMLAAPPLAENGLVPGFSDRHLVEARQTPDASADQLASFTYAVQFAAAAYCNNKASQVGSKVTCSNNACPDVQRRNVVNYAHIDTDINAKLDGAVYLDHDTGSIVLAFMGSKSATSYLLEIDFTVAEVPELCSGCKVSYGIRMVWTQTQRQIVDAITRAKQQYPVYRIVATGHSGGGALASVAASYLRAQSGFTIDLYTFGSPRVGNAAWAQFVTNQAPARGNNYRVTHYNDPIAAIPPTWIDNMAHVSPEYWLARKEATSPNYPLNQVLVCYGVQPDGCRASTGTTLDTSAHSYYFQKVSACY